jgi:hypothetical protein
MLLFFNSYSGLQIGRMHVPNSNSFFNCFSFLFFEAQMLQLHLYKHARSLLDSGLVLPCVIIVSG